MNSLSIFDGKQKNFSYNVCFFWEKQFAPFLVSSLKLSKLNFPLFASAKEIKVEKELLQNLELSLNVSSMLLYLSWMQLRF